MPTPKEPPRISDLDELVPYVRDRVIKVIAMMKAKGWDPVVFETYRTQARQNWLYGIGRTHHKGSPPRTWTLESKHFSRKAVDIISKRDGWSNAKFYEDLGECALKVGLHQIPEEQCHLQWEG